MSYELKQNLANRANYGSKRDLSKIKYLVIHYTNNDGDMENILLEKLLKHLLIILLMTIQ